VIVVIEQAGTGRGWLDDLTDQWISPSLFLEHAGKLRINILRMDIAISMDPCTEFLSPAAATTTVSRVGLRRSVDMIIGRAHKLVYVPSFLSLWHGGNRHIDPSPAVGHSLVFTNHGGRHESFFFSQINFFLERV